MATINISYKLQEFLQSIINEIEKDSETYNVEIDDPVVAIFKDTLEVWFDYRDDSNIVTFKQFLETMPVKFRKCGGHFVIKAELESLYCILVSLSMMCTEYTVM